MHVRRAISHSHITYAKTVPSCTGKNESLPRIVNICFFFGKILVYLWNIDFPKKVSHFKEFPIFGIIVTLESCRNFVGVSHWNIFGIFVETYMKSFSIHFGVLVENFYNLVGIFSYIGDMRTATQLEKLWKLDGNYIRKFLGIRLEFNFGTVLDFLRKHE